MQRIFSLGIDIGTTTTQVIIYEILVDNIVSNYLSVEPKILERKIIYKSDPVITPMYDDYNLNEELLIKIILSFIQQSKIDEKEIKTGAIIITGESSLKDNSSKLIETIADITGEFIVTSAGPNLESILAGFGSGAEEYSKKNSLSIINIDVGGGTTNCVKFDNGKAEDTLTMHIGGRLIRFDENLNVTYLSPVLSKIPFINKQVKIGKQIDEKTIIKITDYMAEALIKGINGCLKDEEHVLYVSENRSLNKCDLYMISGGVGEYVYILANSKMNKTDLFKCCKKYLDIGPFLAKSILYKFKEENLNMVEPDEKLRATVCGAGAYSMKISGNTIFIQNADLPIKNIPLIRVIYNNDVDKFMGEIKKGITYYSGDVAIYITYLGDKSYEEIKKCSRSIVQGLENKSDKIIIIINKNLAKAIGQQISYKVSSEKTIICLDSIENSEGDYIDIGKMLGDSLPVVIKSLVF